MLNPIADKIVDQLIARPAEFEWPKLEPHRSIAKIISHAVGLEKGLPHSPALHPNDMFGPMFWGPFDDLTPLIVWAECREQLKLAIPESVFIDAWEQGWTLRQFIDSAAANALAVP